MPTHPPLPETVRQLAEEALLLALALSRAEEIQWLPSIRQRPREDTTERASGGHSDPTLTTVLDENRVAVRETVEVAHRRLSATVEELHRCRSALERVTRAWEGE